jgi:hypothetical protein
LYHLSFLICESRNPSYFFPKKIGLQTPAILLPKEIGLIPPKTPLVGKSTASMDLGTRALSACSEIDKSFI